MNENPMNQDPLSRLLAKWRPEIPSSKDSFTEDVMRRIEFEATPTYRKSLFESMAEKWLPSPNILLPIAATIILLVNLGYWKLADTQVKRFAALQWHQNLSNPASSLSLNGAFKLENSHDQ
jgi:hypothetical protein